MYVPPPIATSEEGANPDPPSDYESDYESEPDEQEEEKPVGDAEMFDEDIQDAELTLKLGWQKHPESSNGLKLY